MKIAIALTLLCSTAFADESHNHYVALSGVSRDDKLDQRGLAVEAGFGVGAAFHLRGQLAAGTSEEFVTRTDRDPSTGQMRDVYAQRRFEQVRVGFEARGSQEWVRFFGGIDAGYEANHGSTAAGDTEMREYSGALLTAPRVGVEAGKRIRARAALELVMIERFDGDGPTVAAALSLGVGLAF